MPVEFHRSVLGEEESTSQLVIDADPYCIALKHFASLVPIAQRARKPMFELRQADGIGGGQMLSVKRCKQEFDRLVDEILVRLASAPNRMRDRRMAVCTPGDVVLQLKSLEGKDS